MRPESIIVRKIAPCPTKWRCPMYSSKVVGRSRSANGFIFAVYVVPTLKVFEVALERAWEEREAWEMC